MKKMTLVVRRGALRRFERLKRDASQLPIDIVWDRRALQHRRATPRARDRRQKPPFTWDAADFVVVTTRSERRKTGRPKDRKKVPKTPKR